MGTSVPILVFLGLSVLDLGSMYATDRQTDVRQTDVRQTSDVRQKHRLMPPPIRGGDIIRDCIQRDYIQRITIQTYHTFSGCRPAFQLKMVAWG